MIVIIKVLERRGNSTFWHERIGLFLGSICGYPLDHSHQLVEIFTTVGKRNWRQRVSHCTMSQIFDIILEAMKNVTFLGIEDYRGTDKCSGSKICRRVRKVLSNIEKKRYFEEDAHLNAQIWNIMYYKSNVY